MKLVAATQNKGKLLEFTRIFAPFGIEVVSQAQVGVNIEVEETGTTFMENAERKARAVFAATGFACVADDSGLCVDALNGRPGVYSARYAGHNTSHEQKIIFLLEEMKNVPIEKRTAYFESSICCILDKTHVLRASGRCCGSIGFEPKGNNGFGYDPIFMVGDESFAQMSAQQKDAISHRGRALKQLFTLLQKQLTDK